MDDLRDIIDSELSTVDVDLEREILQIIQRGSESNEHVARRPIRELIQNADDAHSDRIHIQFNKSGMTFENDGLGLKGQHIINSEGVKELVGTVKSILRIHQGSKEEDEMASGNFGSGFRSTHLFSDSAEIHGTLNLNGVNIPYVGICSPFTNEVDTRSGESRAIIPTVRNDSERLKRGNGLVNKDDGSIVMMQGLEPSSERCGVAFYWPWRAEAKNKKWDGMIWDAKRVKEAAKDCLDAIPGIILGCRWIREAIVSINLPGLKSTNTWIRDFNIHEQLFETRKIDVSITHYNSTEVYKDTMTRDITDLSGGITQKFWLLTHLDESLKDDAKRADLLPNCMLLVPVGGGGSDLPSYTPIALTISSGNNFSPLGFLPPHESRTKIKVDSSIGHAKINWAANVMNIFCSQLLPSLHKVALEAYKNNEISQNDLLGLIARNRPEKWFGCKELDFYGEEIDKFWKHYTNLISTSEIFQLESGDGFTSAENVVRLKINDGDTRKIITEFIKALGSTIISDEQTNILSSLDNNYWGENNPLEIMDDISSPLQLLKFVENKRNLLTIDNLGSKLVKDLIKVLCIKPKGEWKSEDSKKIPIIPDSEGKLWPLRGDDGKSHFYNASEKFPDLLPINRRLHPDFVKTCSGIQFTAPNAADLAKLVDEVSREREDEFNNLHLHPKLHLQVTEALLAIVRGENYKLKHVAQFRFIPCTQNEKIFVRRPNHIGDLIWCVSDGFPQRNWDSHCHRDFIFADNESSRKALNLHPIIHNKLTWLNLHSKHEKEIDDIRKELKIHKASPQVKGLGLIRSLIFGEDGNGLSQAEPVSIFHRENNRWELEEWIEDDLSPKQIDAALTSVLKLLSDKKQISGGWGAHPKDKLSSLYLLKDEDGKWSKVGELCLELPIELSELFDRRTIFSEHKELLERKLLADDMPRDRNTSGGLGVPERISEDVIHAKIQSLDGQSSEIRTRIHDMMLSSELPWDLKEIQSIPWVPRNDGEMKYPKKCLLPTNEMTEIFGKEHPWFIDTKIDCNAESVQQRAEEIGLMKNHSDSKLLQRALIEPEILWDGFESNKIIQELTTLFVENPEMTSLNRSLRLPNANGKGWSDDSWLVAEDELEDARLIYPESNIISNTELGGVKQGEMAIKWLLPSQYGPSNTDLCKKLVELSRQADVDTNSLDALWTLLNSRKDETGLWFEEQAATNHLKINFNGEVIKLNQLFIVDEDNSEWIDGEATPNVRAMDDAHLHSDLLEKRFHVNHLSAKVNDKILERGFESTTPRPLEIQRHWLLLAASRTSNQELINKNVWPMGYSDNQSDINWKLTKLTHMQSSREALIPEPNDSGNEIKRMIKEQLPLLWLPRTGVLQTKIYEKFEGRKDIGRLSDLASADLDDTQLETNPWPYLTEALENILDALKIIGADFHPTAKKIKAETTTSRIPSRLSARLKSGSTLVFWKESSGVQAISGKLDGDTVIITISTSNEKILDDSKLRFALRKAIGLGEGKIYELIAKKENQWHEINEDLDKEWKNHARPLIEQGLYYEMRPRLNQLYRGCQICKRQTPANRSGDFSEGVIDLFNSKYPWKEKTYEMGAVMYLCPNHYAIHRRSLMNIPSLDEAIKKVKQSNEDTEEIVNSILEKTGDITLSVVTYEGIDGDAKDHTTAVEWKDDHADKFRDIMTRYLTDISR